MEYPLKDLSSIASHYAICVIATLLPNVEFSFPLIQERKFTLSFHVSKGSIKETQFPDIENGIRRLWKEHPEFQTHLMTQKNAYNLFISQNQRIWADSATTNSNTLASLVRIGEYYLPCAKEKLSSIEDLFVRPVLLEKTPQGNYLLTCVFAEEKQELKKNYKAWQEALQKKSYIEKPVLSDAAVARSYSLALDNLANELKTCAKKENFTPVTLLTEKAPTLEEATFLLTEYSPAFSVVNIFNKWEQGAALSTKNPKVSPCDLWVEACPPEKGELRVKYYLQFIEAKCKILGQKTQVVLAVPETKLNTESLRKNTQLLKNWTNQRDCGRIVTHIEKFVRLSWFTQDIFGEYWEIAFIDLLNLDKKGSKSNDMLVIRFSLCGPHMRFLEVIAELNKGLQTSISF